MNEEKIKEAYSRAKEKYAKYDIDTDEAVKKLEDVNISLHCWQGDDVGGFEEPDAELEGGGIEATGNFPGKARTIEELRQDLDKVMSLLPGKQKLNLHASYGDFTGDNDVDRDEITIDNFQGWIDWAKERNTGIDFNCTCFSHPKAASGFTLSSKDEEIRQFWIEHVKRCRKIAAEMGKQTGMTSIHNIWVPDGSKDNPVDRFGHRKLLKDSLDEIFEEEYSDEYMRDSLESKLFGIGAEAMTVGNYDFYYGYAIDNNKLFCLDNGHYHPTEKVDDKIASVLMYLDELMLHLTRGIRWDSDHVVTFNEEIKGILSEVVRCGALDNTNIGLDFFDASINRVGAYITGARAAQKSLLYALLEPSELLQDYEENDKLFERLFTFEKMKGMPWGAVWDYYCLKNDVLTDEEVIPEVQNYEENVLANR